MSDDKDACCYIVPVIHDKDAVPMKSEQDSCRNKNWIITIVSSLQSQHVLEIFYKTPSLDEELKTIHRRGRISFLQRLAS